MRFDYLLNIIENRTIPKLNMAIIELSSNNHGLHIFGYLSESSGSSDT